MAEALRAIARKATPTVLYWLVLSLITFVGMRAVIEIESTQTRLSLVVMVVGVAFSAAYFLECLLRDYAQTDIQPNCELNDTRVRDVITGGLPEWLCRNKERLGAKVRRDAERRPPPSLWVWEIAN